MKRITLAAIVALALLAWAVLPVHAMETKKSWGLALVVDGGVSDPGMNTTLSGVSLPASGNTTFHVDGDTGATQIPLVRYDYDWFTLTPGTFPILSGVTPDFDSDEDTFTIEYKAWSVNTADAYNAAPWIPLKYAKAWSSGDSPYPVSFRCTDDYLSIRWSSSVTPFSHVTATLSGRHSKPWDEETLIVWPEQHSAFAASGVSNDMTSGATGFTLPDGAKYFGFFARGDEVPYSTDGTDASTSGLCFPEDEEKIITREECLKLGTAAAGNAAGTLTMTPYSRRPY